MKQITVDRPAQRKHIDTIEKKIKPLVLRFLKGLETLLDRELCIEAFTSGDFPRSVINDFDNRLERLRQELVYILSNPDHRLVEQIDANEISRIQLKALAESLKEKQLTNLRRQLAILYEFGPTPEILGIIGKTTGLTESQTERVMRARQASLDNGATQKVAARAAANVAARERSYRAIAIARTEAVRHAGSIIQARGEELAAQGKTVRRLWLSSRDEHVCPVCTANDNNAWIGLKDPFPSGHHLPPVHPGCRCVIELYVGDDAPSLMNFAHTETR